MRPQTEGLEEVTDGACSLFRCAFLSGRIPGSSPRHSMSVPSCRLPSSPPTVVKICPRHPALAISLCILAGILWVDFGLPSFVAYSIAVLPFSSRFKLTRHRIPDAFRGYISITCISSSYRGPCFYSLTAAFCAMKRGHNHAKGKGEAGETPRTDREGLDGESPMYHYHTPPPSDPGCSSPPAKIQRTGSKVTSALRALTNRSEYLCLPFFSCTTAAVDFGGGN